MPKDQMPCAHPGCQRFAKAKGYCSTHYTYYRRLELGVVKTPRKGPNDPAIRPYGHDHELEEFKTRLDDETAKALHRVAEKENSSPYQVIRRVMQSWARSLPAEYRD